MSDRMGSRRRPRYRGTHCPYYNPRPEPNPETPDEKARRERRENYNQMMFFGVILSGMIGTGIGMFYFHNTDLALFIGGGTTMVITVFVFWVFSPGRKEKP